MAITAERLREIVNYDPVSGLFEHRSGRKRNCVHRPVARGYKLITIDGIRYPAHRLAWLYMTGEWPRVQIDHADLNKRNNSFSNLREATLSQNRWNIPKRCNNKSGFKGVVKTWGCDRWSSYIGANHRKIYLGTFPTPEDAHAAYAAAAGWIAGEFARAS